jgi:hypothetical protein
LSQHAKELHATFCRWELRAPGKDSDAVGVPIVKKEATKGYGAEVELHGETLQQAIDYAVSQQGFTFVHPYDDDEIIAGQGTMGLEVLESLDWGEAASSPVSQRLSKKRPRP